MLTARTHRTIHEEEVQGHMIVMAQTTRLASNFVLVRNGNRYRWADTRISLIGLF